MPSLEMSLQLRIRSKVNWVQNNKIIDESLLSMQSPAYITLLTLSRMYLRYLLHVLHDIDNN